MLYALGLVLLVCCPLCCEGYRIVQDLLGRNTKLSRSEAVMEILYTTSQLGVVLQLQTALAMIQVRWGFSFPLYSLCGSHCGTYFLFTIWPNSNLRGCTNYTMRFNHSIVLCIWSTIFAKGSIPPLQLLVSGKYGWMVARFSSATHSLVCPTSFSIQTHAVPMWLRTVCGLINLAFSGIPSIMWRTAMCMQSMSLVTMTKSSRGREAVPGAITMLTLYPVFIRLRSSRICNDICRWFRLALLWHWPFPRLEWAFAPLCSLKRGEKRSNRTQDVQRSGWEEGKLSGGPKEVPQNPALAYAFEARFA